MSNIDFRVKPGFFTHFKTGRLESMLGYEGIVKLLNLWGWAAENRPSGELTGMNSDDIEFAIGWKKQRGSFVSALVKIGWLDTTDDGTFLLHDWQEHNPWVVSAPLRSDMGRMGKLASDYPEIYAKFSAAGIRSISKKDYEAEVLAYKTRKASEISNSGYPHAPAPTPKPKNFDLDNDHDHKDQQNYLKDEKDDKAAMNVEALPACEARNDEEIPQNMIPEGMTLEEVKNIRREVREKPGFSELPPFIRDTAVRVMPFAVAKDRMRATIQESQQNDCTRRKENEILTARNFSNLLKQTRELYHSFPGYSPTKGEDEWIITVCQDAGDKACSIIREAKNWVSEKNVRIKNSRGFLTEWIKRVMSERSI